MTDIALPALRPAAPDAWPALPSPTQFDAYARAVQQIPMLTAEEEDRLAQAWTRDQDRTAAWRLVLAHLRLVVRVVRDHESYGVSPGDLAQEGSIGLMKAVRRFDPSRGVRLGAYAVRWIEAEVREYIAHNWRLVRLGSSTAMKKLFFGYRQTVAALRQWGEERDVAPTTQAVADALNLTPAQVARAEAFFRGQDLTLAPSAEEDGDSGAQVQDRWGLQVWTQEGHLTPQERLAEEDLTAFRHRTLDAALAQLPERDRAIFTARRLQEPAEGLAHLGERFQISAERVRQIEARALAQVSQTLRPQAALLQGDEAV